MSTYNLRSCSTVSKRVRTPSSRCVDMDSHPARPKRSKAAHVEPETQHNLPNLLLDLPDNALDTVLGKLGAKELALLQATLSPRQLTFDDRLWKSLVLARWGSITPLMQRAAHHAGSFQALYADKICCERAQAPWQVLCASERAAAIAQLCGESGEQEVLLLFLVDGSGSVTQDDFTAAMSFVKEATEVIVTERPTTQVGLLQFSNDVKEEIVVGAVEDVQAFADAVDAVCLCLYVATSMFVNSDDSFLPPYPRMNGGTNIAAAIHRAGQLLQTIPPLCTRVLCLMTDGRVDRYQSREAANMLSAMAGDEGPRLVLYTFGVGRGVDDHELHFLASMTQGGQPEGPSSGEDSGSPSAARGSPLAARGPFAVAMPMSGASSNSSSSTVEPWSPKAATGPLQRCFMLRVMEDSW